LYIEILSAGSDKQHFYYSRVLRCMRYNTDTLHSNSKTQIKTHFRLI